MSQKKRLSSSSSSGIEPASKLSTTKKPKPQQQLGGGTTTESYEKMGIRELVNEEENVAAELMVLEHGTGVAGAVASTITTTFAMAGGTTTNLSRKKATPPNPAKKLVIKPFKGNWNLSSRSSFSSFRVLHKNSAIRVLHTAIEYHHPVRTDVSSAF
jgi:hypothetical protein